MRGPVSMLFLRCKDGKGAERRRKKASRWYFPANSLPDVTLKPILGAPLPRFWQSRWRGGD